MPRSSSPADYPRTSRPHPPTRSSRPRGAARPPRAAAPLAPAARTQLRALARRWLAVLLLAASGLPATAPAQRVGGSWESPRARALAERATARRAEQIADTLLHDYVATARGFLTFLAQVGEGFPDPPRVVKADELAVRVYWLAPDRSKQVVVGRRDTLLLPADVGYYSDRYGIVQNNFPDRIRLGDGNDVRDVPHPLSTAGLREYEFALGDSIRIRLPGRVIEVLEVRFRPRDPDQPRAVGSLYVDRESADVVRMSLTFTRAAILDRRIETLAVTLENGLVEGRFWLPHHQELEVARTSNWLDFPARGIIRGRWEVGDYQVNRGLDPTIFGGPEIVSESPAALASYPFEGELLARLPADVQAVTPADVERVRSQAESLVRQRMLSRASSPAVSARSASDFLRVNRVEGLALGAGARFRLPGLEVATRARYGLDDARLKGRLTLSRTPGSGGQPGRLELHAGRDYREAGDMAEVSLLWNSLAAQEFGSDYTDPYEVREVGAAVGLGEMLGAAWRAGLAWEEQRAVAVHAVPAAGSYGPTIPATHVAGATLSVRAARAFADGPAGSRLRWDARLDGAGWRGGTATARLAVTAELLRPLGGGELALETLVAGTAGSPLPQQLVYLGGPVTGPGYQYHSLVGRAGASQRVEWRHALPFPAIPLGRFGSAPATMTIAPYAHVAAIASPVTLAGRPGRAAGVYPAVGVAGSFLFDLLRVDVARGLRGGRWTFGVDVSRTLWKIL